MNYLANLQAALNFYDQNHLGGSNGFAFDPDRPGTSQNAATDQGRRMMWAQQAAQQGPSESPRPDFFSQAPAPANSFAGYQQQRPDPYQGDPMMGRGAPSYQRPVTQQPNPLNNYLAQLLGRH